MKITPLVPCPQLPLDGIAAGIYPYLGGSVRADQLRSVVMQYESVIVPGRHGVKLAADLPGVLIDPAVETTFDIFGSDLPEETFAGVFEQPREREWRKLKL